MYPNLYYLLKDLFGVELPFLKVVNTFGFCVAIAFLGAAYLLVKDLKRRQALGEFSYKEKEITVGEPASAFEIFLNFILGFFLGYKIVGVFITPGALADPQAFIFSSDGNLIAGLVAGALFAWLKWREKNKNKLPKPQKKNIRIWPSDRVGDITIISAVFGFLGAKIFDNLENWDRFVQDPIGNLFSPSGLTFYGGLIVATIALWYYFKKNNIPFIKMADATAPSLMFAYGFGRVGCQVAGDGDWGILNSAYIADAQGNVLPATTETFNTQLQMHHDFYLQQFGSMDAVQHKAVTAFAGLPDWFFAYTYPHNVNKEGIPIANCTWDDFCAMLPLPVFPTPLYEVIISLLLFAMLWSLRKKFKVAGRLFALYLIVNGLERFFIEKIRVNTTYDLFGFHPTQAEIISTLLIIAGIILYAMAPKLFGNMKNTNQQTV